MIKIYALYRKKEVGPDFFIDDVVYVGRTKNLKNRIYKHKSKKNFTAYGILAECQTLEEAKQIEDSYIVHYNPEYNRSLNKTGEYRKMSELIKILNIKENEYAEFIDYLLIKGIKPIFKDNYNPHTIEVAYLYSKNGFY